MRHCRGDIQIRAIAGVDPTTCGVRRREGAEDDLQPLVLELLSHNLWL